MQTVRQMASGIVYAIVSLLLVIGSLSLSLAQGGTAGPPTVAPKALPSSTSTRMPSQQPTVVGFASATTSSTATATQLAPTSTYFYPTVATAARPTSTTTWTCGPHAGWVHGYVVQPADTLFRIATMHGITVDALQRANCRTGTLIYVGERLWVPFVLPPATELTIIPTFDTPTGEPATPTASLAPSDTPTETQDP